MVVTLDNLRIRAVGRRAWDDMVRLFEGRGGPRHCWCMIYRPFSSGSYGRADSAAKKEGMREIMVDDETPVGLLAYLDEEPVAWCSVAPLESYRSLRGRGYSREEDEDIGDVSDDEVWSIACFFIRSGFRRQGMMRRMISAAIEYARENGARMVEAYPIERGSQSYRFMGYIDVFESMGFHEVGMAGSRRHIMRLRL